MNNIIENFKMPRYSEIPDVGLYLEQTVKYINTSLAPLGCMELTSSMISNYVKHKYIEKPVKKQYSREQIAYLLFIAVAKNVLSMENMIILFSIQREKYTTEAAYEYFCDELETTLHGIFDPKMRLCDGGNVSFLAEEKRMLKSAVIAAANIIYLDNCFRKRGV